MRVFAAVLVAGLAVAQEGPTYTPERNPFQREYAFEPGQRLELRVDVEGLRLDAITVTPLEEGRAQEQVQCDVQLTGTNTAKKKASLIAVLLLEDASGKGLGRVQMVPFKVKAGKPFDEKQRLAVASAVLAAAVKVYVFVQVGF